MNITLYYKLVDLYRSLNMDQPENLENWSSERMLRKIESLNKRYHDSQYEYRSSLYYL